MKALTSKWFLKLSFVFAFFSSPFNFFFNELKSLKDESELWRKGCYIKISVLLWNIQAIELIRIFLRLSLDNFISLDITRVNLIPVSQPFINALLGRSYFKEGAVPTTNESTFLCYSELDSSGEQRCEKTSRWSIYVLPSCSNS